MLHKSRKKLLAALAAFAVVGVSAADAQGVTQGDALKTFGIDQPTFQRLFGDVLERKPPVPTTAAGAAADIQPAIDELRVFLTDKPGTVIGEIALSREVRLPQLTFDFENGPVTFRDDGVSPDREKGDAVFTAAFPMRTDQAFDEFRQQLRASVDTFRGQGGSPYIQRGPRDIVPAKEEIERLRKESPRDFVQTLAAVDQSSKLVEFRDPLEAAKAVGIDIARTPFLTFPGPLAGTGAGLRLAQLFGNPVLTPFPLPLPTVVIDRDRSLMVTDVGVVEDTARTFDACTGTGTPGGPWSFGYLMRQMSHGTGLTPEQFVQVWLSSWGLPQAPNGTIVLETGRAQQLHDTVIASWEALSPNHVLNVDFFPARLMAIVNRPDLADRIGYGAAGSAGEGRFVFGLVEANGGACLPLRFTVIFEYGIKGGSCMAVKAWHQRWKDLDAHNVGTAGYNVALEAITHDFTDTGTNPSQSPNLSSLNQLRTNELALGPIWQLREFRLNSLGLLALDTVKQTPLDELNNSSPLSLYIASAEPDILADKHKVPAQFPLGSPFLAAKSDVPFPPNLFFWSTPVPPAADTRRKFSLGTCSGCHAGETQTFFTHIGASGTRQMTQPASLSGFLTGEDVTVPVSGGTQHYEDLAERQAKMSSILTNSCFHLLAFKTLPFAD